MSPYKEYNFTAWFMWIAYGLGWGIWLLNLLFDNKAGKIHSVFVVATRVMVAPPFFQFLLIFVLFFAYGSTE